MESDPLLKLKKIDGNVGNVGELSAYIGKVVPIVEKNGNNLPFMIV